ncbi:MAG: response regulator [Candidatus Sumerlaeia bacterium]|nr:response regulator [Candidatus Sumerlaeia bacterium]
MPETATPVRVLIVDDNRIYRDAFRRNLLLNDYDVSEAADSEEAMAAVREHEPHVVVTDLQMRTDREGLDLIRELKRSSPLTPVIMISAVGSFEEGAEAMQMGAVQVIHKSRIDDEIQTLYDAIERSAEQHAKNRETLDWIAGLAGREDVAAGERDRLQKMVMDTQLLPHVRGEAFEALTALDERALRDQTQAQVSGAGAGDFAEVERLLAVDLPEYSQLSSDSRDALRAAEYLYQQESRSPAGVNFSRSIGFSYCFAVENEAKSRLRRRIQKMLGADDVYKIIPKLMDVKKQQLDLFYHQHILQLQRLRPMDFTVDNVRQTLLRIMEHRARYKPDGLKAIGIMILVFGRPHTFKGIRGEVEVPDVLRLRELEGDEALDLAEFLIALQHLRNPYIHPEINEMEKVGSLRQQALRCLRQVTKLAA